MKKIVLVSLVSFNLFGSNTGKDLSFFKTKVNDLLNSAKKLHQAEVILKEVCDRDNIPYVDNTTNILGYDIKESLSSIFDNLKDIESDLYGSDFKDTKNFDAIIQKIDRFKKGFNKDTKATTGEILPYSSDRNATSLVNNANDDDDDDQG